MSYTPTFESQEEADALRSHYQAAISTLKAQMQDMSTGRKIMRNGVDITESTKATISAEIDRLTNELNRVTSVADLSEAEQAAYWNSKAPAASAPTT